MISETIFIAFNLLGIIYTAYLLILEYELRFILKTEIGSFSIPEKTDTQNNIIQIIFFLISIFTLLIILNSESYKDSNLLLFTNYFLIFSILFSITLVYMKSSISNSEFGSSTFFEHFNIDKTTQKRFKFLFKNDYILAIKGVLIKKFNKDKGEAELNELNDFTIKYNLEKILNIQEKRNSLKYKVIEFTDNSTKDECDIIVELEPSIKKKTIEDIEPSLIDEDVKEGLIPQKEDLKSNQVQFLILHQEDVITCLIKNGLLNNDGIWKLDREYGNKKYISVLIFKLKKLGLIEYSSYHAFHLKFEKIIKMKFTESHSGGFIKELNKGIAKDEFNDCLLTLDFLDVFDNK